MLIIVPDQLNTGYTFRQHQMVGREGKGGHSFLAIDHIRDQLIPPQVRQCSGDQCQHTFNFVILKLQETLKEENKNPDDNSLLMREVGEPVIRKIRDYLGVFPIRGRGVSQNPKTFVI